MEHEVNDHSKDKRQLLKNTAANVIAQIATILTTLIFTPRLIALFGTSGYALYILAASMPSYATLLDFGVGTALTKFVASFQPGDDEAHQPVQLVRATLLIYTAVGVLTAAGLFILTKYPQLFSGITSSQASQLGLLLNITALGQLFYWPLSTFRNYLAGRNRYDLVSRNALLGTCATIAVTLWVLATQASMVTLTLGINIVLVLTALLNVGDAARIRRTNLRAAKRVPFKQSARVLLTFSWPVFVMQLTDVLFYQQTDRLVLGAFVGLGAVTLYEGAGKFNAIIIMLSGLAVSAVMPLASKMHGEKRRDANSFLFVEGTRYLLALLVPMIVVLSLFAEPLLVGWLGKGFAGQGIVAATLLLPHVLVAAGLVGDAVLIGVGGLRKRVPYAIAQSVINVGLSIVLAPRFGVLGVAVGTAIAHLIDIPFHYSLLTKTFDVPVRYFLKRTLVPVLSLALPLALVSGVIIKFAHPTALFSLAGILCILCIGYWLVYFYAVLSRDERQYLLSHLKRA